MTTNAIPVRRARIAIFGPFAAGVIGATLIAAGVAGLVIHRSSHATRAVTSPATVSLPPATFGLPRTANQVVPTAGLFGLVTADGVLSMPGDPELGQLKGTHAGTFVGAATNYDGGVWLVTDRGQVIGLHAPVLGSMPQRASTPPVVGIEPAANGHGYRLLTRDGRVHAFGAPKRLGVARFHPTSAVVGIAPAAHDGYWVVLANGHVYAINAPSLGSAKLGSGAAPVVGIASSVDGRGYRLVTADGKVYAFGLPAPYPSATKFSGHVVGIASAPNDGYWLATDDGHTYGFGISPVPASTKGRVVAIFPN
jgi:hypothetical protein